MEYDHMAIDWRLSDELTERSDKPVSKQKVDQLAIDRSARAANSRKAPAKRDPQDRK